MLRLSATRSGASAASIVASADAFVACGGFAEKPVRNVRLGKVLDGGLATLFLQAANGKTSTAATTCRIRTRMKSLRAESADTTTGTTRTTLLPDPSIHHMLRSPRDYLATEGPREFHE
jgi:hypothetical protein